jgi:hypothetical protein
MGGLGLAQQGGALEIGGKYHLNEALWPVGCFLREAADAPARRNGDLSGFGWNVAADGLKQRRLSSAVAADQADPRAGNDLRGGMIDQQAAGNAHRDVG